MSKRKIKEKNQIEGLNLFVHTCNSETKHDIATTVTMMMSCWLKKSRDQGGEGATHPSKGSDHAISITNTVSLSYFVSLLCYRTFISTCMYK